MVNPMRLATIALLSTVLAGTASCGAAPTPTPVILEKTVRQTVLVPTQVVVRETVPVVTRVVITATPVPTAKPEERRRIVLYDSYSILNPAEPYSKVVAAAFANGIRLEASESQGRFAEELEKSDVAAAIYGSGNWWPSASVLVKLAEFARRGGRAFIMYSRMWSDSALLLQDLFSISVAREVVARSGSILFPESALPGFMKELKVGMESKYGDPCLGAYLVTVEEEAERGTLVGASSGKERTIYYSDPEGRVMFWPKVEMVCGSGSDSILHDHYFDQFQNEEAVVVLLKYLVER